MRQMESADGNGWSADRFLEKAAAVFEALCGTCGGLQGAVLIA